MASSICMPIVRYWFRELSAHSDARGGKIRWRWSGHLCDQGERLSLTSSPSGCRLPFGSRSQPVGGRKMRYSRTWHRSDDWGLRTSGRQTANRPEQTGAPWKIGKKRVLKKVGHRVLRAVRGMCAALLPLVLLSNAFAGGCDPTMVGEPAVYQATDAGSRSGSRKRFVPKPH